MFEKDAYEYREKGKREGYYLVTEDMEQEGLDYIIDESFKDGAEFGYNKANEWHYVKDGDLPKEDKDGNILVYHTSYGGHCEVGYFKVKDKSFMDSDIIAWKEIIPPKESE